MNNDYIYRSFTKAELVQRCIDLGINRVAMLAERSRLRAELAKADGQINRCVEQNRYLESTISRLREYAWHKRDCMTNWPQSKDPSCDCGYDDLVKEIGV